MTFETFQNKISSSTSWPYCATKNVVFVPFYGPRTWGNFGAYESWYISTPEEIPFCPMVTDGVLDLAGLMLGLWCAIFVASSDCVPGLWGQFGRLHQFCTGLDRVSTSISSVFVFLGEFLQNFIGVVIIVCLDV